MPYNADVIDFIIWPRTARDRALEALCLRLAEHTSPLWPEHCV